MGSTSMRNSVSLPLAKEWLQRGREPVSATRIGKMIYTSGVPGIDRKTGLLAAGAERQFAAAFDNLTALLEAAGAGPQPGRVFPVWVPSCTHHAFFNKELLSLYPRTT